MNKMHLWNTPPRQLQSPKKLFSVHRNINIRRTIVPAPGSAWSLVLLSIDTNFDLTFHIHLFRVAFEIWLPLANYDVFLQLLLVQRSGQSHKVIDLGVIGKGSISGVCMPNIKSVSLMVQRYNQGQQSWQQTDKKTNRQEKNNMHKRPGALKFQQEFRYRFFIIWRCCD